MERIKSYVKNNKLRVAVLLILLVCFVGGLIFIDNDYFLYKDTIVSVLDVTETEYVEFNAKQPSYEQNVTAEIMNGEHKGTIIEFENKRTYSGLIGYSISKGDDLFVGLDSNLTLQSILGEKRDFYVALLVFIFCFLLIAVASRKSLLFLVSTIINIGLFTLIIFFRSKHYNILMLCIIATILFTVITLFIISGINKKTISAIISTLISITLMMVIAVIVFQVFENTFYYETVEFLTYLYDYRSVLYCSVLISGLGAIMDNTVIIATAINELISKNPDIGTKELRHSAWEIAQDISGTMMNVLFFSCIIGALPSIILTLSNGMDLFFAIEYFGSVEIIRALVGCIGIVLAVPISYFVNISLRRRIKS